MNNAVLFRQSEVKSETITIRLSPSQKYAVLELAAQRGTNASKLFLGLMGNEFERINDTPDYDPVIKGIN